MEKPRPPQESGYRQTPSEKKLLEGICPDKSRKGSSRVLDFPVLTPRLITVCIQRTPGQDNVEKSQAFL